MAVPAVTANRDREILIKASTEAAQHFVEKYYSAVTDAAPIASFYISNNAKYQAASAVSDISVNGALLSNPAEYESLLDRQRTTGAGSKAKVLYEVGSYDVQVLNPQFGTAIPPHILAQGPDKYGARASLLVQVSGTVSFGGSKDAVKTIFSETFVLVPNWDSFGRNAPRNLKRWLIMSQNFRALA